MMTAMLRALQLMAFFVKWVTVKQRLHFRGCRSDRSRGVPGKQSCIGILDITFSTDTKNNVQGKTDDYSVEQDSPNISCAGRDNVCR